MPYTVALFGEAELGDFKTAYFCDSLSQLSDIFGETPPESLGLEFAVQALLYNRGLVFFRVHEEGFSVQDYLLGLNFLENQDYVHYLSAICLPGVGCREIIEATEPVCAIHKSFLVLNERDLYDYLTAN